MLLALSPLHVWYSQECRAFAIWVLLILAAYLCFFRWQENGRILFLFLNGLFVTLSVAFHYFGFHVVIIQNVFLILTRNRTLGQRWKQWVISQAILALALIPFAVMMLTVDRTNVAWWRESGIQLQVFKGLIFHLNGVYFFLAHQRLFKLALLLLNTLMLFFGLYALRKQRSLIFLLSATCLPVIVNLIYSVLASPIVGNSQSAGRYFLFILPPYLVLQAAGWQYVLERFSTPRVPAIAMAVLIMLNLLGVRASWTNRPFARDNNRRLCEILLAGATESDWIIASPYITLEYYAAVLNHEVDHFQIIETSRFDKELEARLPEQADRIWLFLDPVHHFESLLQDIEQRYGMSVRMQERERGLSGVGLFLLESDAGKDRVGE